MIRILQGDCRDVLATLPGTSVHCCVTSPPYFGLRDYGCDGQVGLESTPDAYVAELVTVFRQVRRVLHPSGVCFLNLGDSYSGGKIGRTDDKSFPRPRGGHRATAAPGFGMQRPVPDGHKPKDLLGIPWHAAFALRADGWYLRKDIIWHKRNPMPESVSDRPTSAHEYLFLLSKSQQYYYDAWAVRNDDCGRQSGNGFARTHDMKAVRLTYGGRGQEEQWTPGGGSNLRSVWEFGSEPFSEAHFATMPPSLAERCIMLGTSEAGCCPQCLAPWQRIVERGEPDREWQRACGGDVFGEYAGQSTKDHNSAGVQNASDVKRRILEGMREKRTTGWRPTCDCPEHTPRACTVLDPFSGAGTTLLAADRLRRDAIGVELNGEYVAMSERRLRGDAGLFAEVTAA